MEKMKVFTVLLTSLLVLGFGLTSCDDGNPWNPELGSSENPIRLTENTWADGRIISKSGGWSNVHYSFSVTSGTTYYVWWNDSNDGDSTKTADISVSAYYTDTDNNYGGSLFSSQVSGWTSPRTFRATTSGTIRISVGLSYRSGGYTEGTFAIAYSSSTTIAWPPGVSPPPPIYTTVPGATLDDKFSWLQTNAVSNGGYAVDVSSSTSGGLWILNYGDRENVTIRLSGSGSSWNPVSITILNPASGMFRVGSGVVLELNNITLRGSNAANPGPIINVLNGGTLRMGTGSSIVDNIKGVGVGVSGGTFTMAGGTVSGNTRGVDVSGGTFTMTGGTISGADSSLSLDYSEAVYMAAGTFTMSGGAISGSDILNRGVIVRGSNTIFIMNSGATISGNDSGGVYVYDGSFTMNGGTISGNTGNPNGGGVYVGANASFTMTNGTITGNTSTSGGGVYVYMGSFTKTGGTITAYSQYSSTGGNVVKDSDGNVVWGRGHAVYAHTPSEPKIKDTAATGDLSFYYNNGECYWTGTW